MIYLTGVSNRATRSLRSDSIGLLATPDNGVGSHIGDYQMWAADNGCYAEVNGRPFDSQRWATWLFSLRAQARTCAFAVLPDVVGDAAATWERSAPWLHIVREMGYVPAYVLQNGVENVGVPWEHIGAVFVGGDDEFKLGEVAAFYVAMAKAYGLWAHMGRVNTRGRLEYAANIGCDSVDGTMLRFGPTENLRKLTRWMHEVAA